MSSNITTIEKIADLKKQLVKLEDSIKNMFILTIRNETGNDIRINSMIIPIGDLDIELEFNSNKCILPLYVISEGSLYQYDIDIPKSYMDLKNKAILCVTNNLIKFVPGCSPNVAILFGYTNKIFESHSENIKYCNIITVRYLLSTYKTVEIIQRSLLPDNVSLFPRLLTITDNFKSDIGFSYGSCEPYVCTFKCHVYYVSTCNKVISNLLDSTDTLTSVSKYNIYKSNVLVKFVSKDCTRSLDLTLRVDNDTIITIDVNGIILINNKNISELDDFYVFNKGDTVYFTKNLIA